jgi:hypothetical protein
MRTFNKVCAQGDVYIQKVDTMPTKDMVEVPAENGVVIVTHSETGHHHVMEATKVKMYALPNSLLDCLLVVNDPVALKHLRDHDTHEPIMFEKGTYKVTRQREYTAEGFRKAQD